MTEQEFRDSCAKFDIRVLLGAPSKLLGEFRYMGGGDYLLCQWNDIIIGHYNKNSCLAVITDNFVRDKLYIFNKRYDLVYANFKHTTNFLHNDKMEERFVYLIKTYKQEIINERLKKLENVFE